MFPQYDLGVHYFDPKLFYNNSNKPPHVASGTLYLRDNNNIFKLIEDWINCCSSVKWEQMALQKAIEKNPEIKVYNLIREYCYIETQPNGKPPSHPIEFPIISHFQSSRKMRR